MSVKDSNGTELNDGDSVQVIKDLKVKLVNRLRSLLLTQAAMHLNSNHSRIVISYLPQVNC